MIEARHVAFAYQSHQPVLDDICMSLTPDSFLAILGVNGSGKSTLLSCMTDMLTPQAGEVLLDSQPIHHVPRRTRAQKVALVEQHSHAGRMTVFDSVLLGRKPHIDKAPTQDDLQRVHDILRQLKLDKLSVRYADELSGGEYQKVILARALCQQTPIILLDEPTNNLDPANQQEIMKALRTIADTQHCAVAAVLHDINLALRYCDTFLLLKDGHVHAYGSQDIITEQSIFDVYGMETDLITHNGKKVVIPR